MLDPYGLQLDWKVIDLAGKMKTVELFINFPVMDMNRNAIWHDHEKVDEAQLLRMDRFWGDRTWRDVAYKDEKTLFETLKRKVTNEDFAEAFRARLEQVAGFKYVPKPLPMKNKKGAVVYYLFFASMNYTAKEIVEYIFNKHSKGTWD